jgi:ATP-dependent DNA helicase RecG
MPRVTEQMQPDRVKWMLPMVSLIPEESLQRLKRQFGADFDHFSTLEVQALVTADIEKRVDNRRLQQITAEHAADITHLLQSLVTRKALVKQGHGRWSWYHLPQVDSRDHSLGNGDRFLGNDDRSLGNGGRILVVRPISSAQDFGNLISSTSQVLN